MRESSESVLSAPLEEDDDEVIFIFRIIVWQGWLYQLPKNAHEPFPPHNIKISLANFVSLEQIYVVHSISFQTFFVWAFKIVVDSWKFTVIHLMRWLTNFYDFSFKWTATAAIGIHPTDCHSWWISKMKSGREDTLEERYAIKFCFKLGKKMPQKRMECFKLLLEHLAWIEHQFLGGTRDSRKARSLWGMMRGVGGVR